VDDPALAVAAAVPTPTTRPTSPSPPGSAEPDLAAEPAPSAEAVAASADRLLGALRALDLATTRDAVIDAAVAFVRQAAPRAGFAARKGELLTGHRGQGAPLAATLELGAGPLAEAIARSARFRGGVAGAEAGFAASLLGGPTALVTAIPIVVRERMVGALLAETTPALVEEHVAVIARAAGVALERILMQQKRP
jgi:hypothetical protein